MLLGCIRFVLTDSQPVSTEDLRVVLGEGLTEVVAARGRVALQASHRLYFAVGQIRGEAFENVADNHCVTRPHVRLNRVQGIVESQTGMSSNVNHLTMRCILDDVTLEPEPNV